MVPHGPTAQQIGNSRYANAILLDTGALLALANSNDGHHAEATNCLNEIARQRLPVCVTLTTISETYSRILFDLGQEKARFFLSQIYDGSIEIIPTTVEDEGAARQLIEDYLYLKLTFFDALTMAVMNRLQIRRVFSFDRHFIEAGFSRMPPYID